MKIKKLVTGVGPLREADAVLPAAAALAGRAGLPLEVVHAFDVSDPFVDTYLRATTVPGDPLRHYAEGLQARMEGQIGGLAGCGDVHCRAQPGAAPAILHDATCGGDCLLVVGPTRRGRAGAALLGTTAQRVLHGAATPVLVLHGELPPSPRVLLCVDLGSPGAARMVEEGLTVLGALCPDPAQARILLVVGMEMDLPIPGLHDRLGRPRAGAAGRFVAELRRARGWSRGSARALPRGRRSPKPRSGRRTSVVVGSHGRTGAARALLGSVAEAVVRDAHCSVLVIPPGAAG
jgi:nucleotide-binding universal stress UspA family protein